MLFRSCVNEAKKLCPKIVLLKPEYGYYHQLSTDLFLLLCEHIPHVKQASIDEFYCDINGLNVEPYQFAQNIKKLVLDKIGLPISIGIAHTPHIAKLATTMAKPDGVLHVPKEKFLDFIESIPVKKFAGVGKSYLKKMKKYNINTLGEAYRAKHILHNWGKYGKDLHSKISGECEELQSHSDRKSIGISKTFEPLKDRVELKRRVLILLRHLSFLVSKLDVVPTTYQFGIKYQNGVKFSSQNSIDRHFSEKLLKDTILAIYHKIDIYPQLHVLYISISLSSFLQNSKKSLSILDFNEDEKAGKITKSLHKIRQIYGIDSIYLADELLASSEKVSLD